MDTIVPGSCGRAIGTPTRGAHFGPSRTPRIAPPSSFGGPASASLPRLIAPSTASRRSALRSPV